VYLFTLLQSAAVFAVIHHCTTKYRGIFHISYRSAKSLVSPNTTTGPTKIRSSHRSIV